MPDIQNSKSEVVGYLITIGTKIAGGVTGAAIGLFTTGPAGALAGGVAGPIVTHVFRKIAVEV
jgi:outer membrane lipoprotein SlyB